MQTKSQVQATHKIKEESDASLVQRVLNGDERAFERLMERYRRPLTQLVYRIVHDYHLTQDILQYVYLQLYLSSGILQQGASIRAWLYKVARNRSLDELRRKHVIYFSELRTLIIDEEELSPLDVLPDPNPLPEEVVEKHDLKQRVHAAINALPPKLRRVVWLRYTSQLSFGEISRLLNIPEATAKTYFQRAKPLLRSALIEARTQLLPA